MAAVLRVPLNVIMPSRDVLFIDSNWTSITRLIAGSHYSSRTLAAESFLVPAAPRRASAAAPLSPPPAQSGGNIHTHTQTHTV